jgi:TM2 domain-containing membrane protein YozV
MQIVDENGNTMPNQSSKRVVAGILGIILGALGIHKFILGYTTEGIVMLLLTVITCGIAGWLMGLIGLIEGIIYLTKSDEEFVQIYQANKKGWF